MAVIPWNPLPHPECSSWWTNKYLLIIVPVSFTQYANICLTPKLLILGLYIYIYICTGCPRRNVPDFGRMFLKLKYTDITKNTYIRSWTVTEIKAREKCGLLAVPRTVPGSRDVIPIRRALSVLVYSRLKRVTRCNCTCKALGTLRTTTTLVQEFM